MRERQGPGRGNCDGGWSGRGKKGSSRQVRDSSVVLSKKWNLTEPEENEDNGEIMIEREEQKQNVNTSTEKNADNVNFYF